MNYKDCNVLCEIKRKEVPLISHVEIDEFTEMVQNNFDYDFTLILNFITLFTLLQL